MKNDVIEVCILKADGEILYNEYFNGISDNENEKQSFIQFVDENKGEYEISIKHYDRKTG